MKKALLLVSLMLSVVFAALAQERTVSGVITDPTGETLPGVAVVVKGTTQGTVTGIDGSYRLMASGDNPVLIFKIVGYKTQEVPVGTRSEISITLEEDIEQLDEIVVTALGIEKDKKSLGYSVTEVKGDDLKGAESGVLNNLNGKVAGVMVNTSSGAPGASSRITIRGNSSLTGNNQPLFVIDGIPVDNTYNSGNTSSGGADYGSPINDINPDDIASMSVLKGPNAAALYGSRAQNGAIVITTKSGKGTKGLGVSLSHSTTFQNPLVLPDYQNRYGQGFNGEFSYVDGTGTGGGINDGFDESWGPKLDAGLMLPQFNTDGVATPWVSRPDNIKNFFETGRVSTTNLSIQSASDKSNVRFSMMYSDQKGMVPNTGLENYSASINFGHKISDKLQLDSKIAYSRRSSDNLPQQGYGAGNVMQQFVWFGRQVDIAALKNYKKADGTPFNWNYSYHDNPYWILNENTNSQLRDRINGFASLKWNITDYLNFKVKGGTDLYTENRLAKTAMYTLNDKDGGFKESNYFVNETNFDFSFSKDFGSDWNVNANFGGNNMYRMYRRGSMEAFGLASPGVYTPANATGVVESTSYFEEQIINSLYGTASIGYRDFLFADISIRNDWSSTLPIKNNSFLYPSVNLSYVFSEHFDLPSFITSGKVRGGWAEVGNGADPYSTRNVFVSALPYNGYPMFKHETTQANPDLKPETTQSWEVGLDMGFFNDRLGFEAAYYEKSTYDQIVPADVSAASGYRYSYINAGQIDNKGFELMVRATPVRTSDITWDLSFNFAKNQNEVVELAEGIDSFVLGSYWSATTEARPGEQLGTFYGYAYERDDNGNIVVGANGTANRTQEKVKLGSINPDWRGGIRNTVSYKNLTLSALVDVSMGGDIFSVTNMFGEYAGVLDHTAEGRESGRVVQGVTADGAVNTKVINAQTYYQSKYGIHEAFIYDASYVKLAELSLTYSIPSTITKKYGVQGMSVAFVGNNLLMIYRNAPHIDPQSGFGSGLSGQGFEFGQLPSPRSLGFDIKMKF
ncbi:SusC/RagA family TonB-linked outer membrane protein [Flammeovirga aprica]|uniref:SusC/RagA family TonB-linked outer membrane protein n=1 Tax=Flammeovirga aprica JL-4 TaxID=694437 RepID=A0A7X9P1K0_9BACT|nr:SusC/RagA family TonB-linked outer membrane protein [Flammeovirga aprica]NME67327.1 SusC/RagA family TonB-linked outer membrane protein [Flammeovirga aprica JL-4]